LILEKNDAIVKLFCEEEKVEGEAKAAVEKVKDIAGK